MRVIPGGSSAEIAALIGVSRSSVLGRMRRLARPGVVTKGPGGYWRVVERQSDDQDISEFETPERPAPLLVFDRTRWIWPIIFSSR
jgi:DNA-binding FadR family transcriptional regulator